MQTDYSSEKTKVKPEKIRVLAFRNSEEVLGKIEKLYCDQRFRNLKSDLYRLNDIYLLVFHLKFGEICDIRSFTDKTHYCYLLEHGSKICENNAIFRIGKAMTKNS